MGRKKKGIIYQLVDPFILFYFRFVEPWKGNDRRHWTLTYHSAAMNTWRGYAFQLVCLLHGGQLRRALGIDGIEADFHSWRWNPDDPAEKGIQIDLLIDRADRIVNLCEIKYSETPYILDREEYEKICRRVDVFRGESGIGKAVQAVLIASHGVAPGRYRGNIQREVSGDDLFQ